MALYAKSSLVTPCLCSSALTTALRSASSDFTTSSRTLSSSASRRLRSSSSSFFCGMNSCTTACTISRMSSIGCNPAAFDLHHDPILHILPRVRQILQCQLLLHFFAQRGRFRAQRQQLLGIVHFHCEVRNIEFIQTRHPNRQVIFPRRVDRLQDPPHQILHRVPVR